MTDECCSYTRALEERVAFLEKKLGQSEPSATHNTGTNVAQSTWSPQGGQTTPQTASGLDNNPVGEIVGLLALSSSEAPAYVGSSSGLALAANLGEMVQTSVWNQFIARMQPHLSTGASPGSQNAQASLPGLSHQAGGACRNRTNVDPPSDEMGSKFLETYFRRLHSRYPFLDRSQLWKMHEDRWRLAKAKREDLTRSDRFALFKLNIVYAIGATMLQLSEKYVYTAPEV